MVVSEVEMRPQSAEAARVCHLPEGSLLPQVAFGHSREGLKEAVPDSAVVRLRMTRLSAERVAGICKVCGIRIAWTRCQPLIGLAVKSSFLFGGWSTAVAQCAAADIIQELE